MPSSPEVPVVMRAARYYTAEDIRVEEMPVPEPRPGEALVRVAACGICTGELMPWYMARKAPMVPGHEPAGRIVALGPDTEGWRVGERVFVHHHAPCGHCAACRRGAFVHCPTWRKTKLVPGGMAEYFLVGAANLAADTLRLPEQVSDAAATMIEPLACSVKALRRGGFVAGQSVVVIGMGFMGLLNAALAIHWGASPVIVADLVPERVARAAALVPTRAVNSATEDLSAIVRELTDSEGASLVVVGPGSIAALESGLACTANGGTLVQFAPTPPATPWSLDFDSLYFREISIVPSYSCGPDDTRVALDLISGGHFPTEKFIDKAYPLEDITTAFTEMARGREIIKAIISFDSA